MRQFTFTNAAVGHELPRRSQLGMSAFPPKAAAATIRDRGSYGPTPDSQSDPWHIVNWTRTNTTGCKKHVTELTADQTQRASVILPQRTLHGRRKQLDDTHVNFNRHTVDRGLAFPGIAVDQAGSCCGFDQVLLQRRAVREFGPPRHDR